MARARAWQMLCLWLVSAACVAASGAESAAAGASGGGGGGSERALRDDVRALQVQVATLLQRRSEDFKLLEDSLRGSLEKSLELSSLRSQVDALRQEVEELRGTTRARNDHVTLQWLSAAVGELRAEAAEAAAARNASRDLQRAQQTDAQLRLLRSDVAALRGEAQQLRAQAQRDAVALQALRGDLDSTQQRAQAAAEQCADNKEQLETAVNDWTSSMKELRSSLKDKKRAQHDQSLHDERARRRLQRRAHNAESNEVVPSAAAEAPLHRLRHAGAREAAARLAARVTALERAGAARAAALDKLHLSALQLLEGVEALEAKVDRALPDVRREVARAEAGVAQLQAGVQVLKEQQENQRVTVRALAGGQAALQEKLEGARALFANITAAANASAPPPAHGDDAGDVEARLGRVERQLHHMQEAAWVPDAFANASTNASAGAKPDGNEGDVHNMVRQLARVQEEYQNIVSRLPAECGEVAGPSGLYLLAPGGEGAPVVAACDQATAGGGWTLVQRRVDGALDFNRKWREYADGFGSPAGEFWLGNTALHRLTADNCSTLRVDLRDIYGKVWVAEYSDFHVSSAADGFRLRVSGYSGNASDALDYQNRMQFSAIDADRDASNTHCAANYEGGWWFSHCQHANLNGRYNLGLTWFDAARNEWIAVAWSEMKVRRRPGCAT
ncbi:hypothetical protein R5R35_007116 [Gryllus longicercus]|uniref:Fibrinogen C-terminal domain-containing protein n=1 Tax=Gryllus longicercus TaxID=2509291 RepID=A0AAN9VQJ1_9ORTH